MREGGFLPEEAALPPRRPGASAQHEPSSLQQQQQRREREQQLLLMQQQHSTSNQPCPHCSASDPWVAAFGACSRCCPSNEQHLISKKTAKELYLLTDGDLKGLGSLLRANPHGATLAPMRLFLEAQVRSVAAERHGVVAGGAAGASTSWRNQRYEEEEGNCDDEEDEEDCEGEGEGEGGFIRPNPSNDSLEARLEAARRERLEKRLSLRASRRAADASREGLAAAKLARARAAVEERSRLELDEGQRVAKKKNRTKGKKKKKGEESESESCDESEESDKDGKEDDTGVEVETI